MFSKKWQLFAGVRSKAYEQWRKKTNEFTVELVKFLQRKESRLNRLQKIWCLMFFIGLCGGASVYILTDTIRSKPAANIPPFEFIKQPVIPQRHQPWLSAQDTLKIKAFKSLIDSLGKTPEGRAQLDDYARRHPGLLDSFNKMQQNIR